MTEETWKEMLGFIARGFRIEIFYQRKIQAFGVSARYHMEDGMLFTSEAFDTSVSQVWDRVKRQIAAGIAEGKLKK